MITNLFKLSVLLLALTVLISSCGDDDDEVTYPEPTVVLDLNESSEGSITGTDITIPENGNLIIDVIIDSPGGFDEFQQLNPDTDAVLTSSNAADLSVEDGSTGFTFTEAFDITGVPAGTVFQVKVAVLDKQGQRGDYTVTVTVT